MKTTDHTFTRLANFNPETYAWQTFGIVGDVLAGIASSEWFFAIHRIGLSPASRSCLGDLPILRG